MEIKSNNYSIFFGKQGYYELKDTIKKYSKIFLIIDKNVEKYCLDKFVQKSEIQVQYLIETESGEKNKTLKTVELIFENLVENNADKNSLIINLGGGLICDMGGFSALCYKRGIDFINIPTTLLGVVDASIGSKTGVNFLGLKNIIGGIYDPKMVLIDVDFLKTLDDKQLLSGYAEMIKHRCIKGDDVMRFIENLSFDENEIKKSISVKNDIVTKDLRENHERKILNFGHTIGHAMESYFIKNNIDTTHGESIVIGMICEFFLAEKKGLVSKKFVDGFKSNITKIYAKKNVPEEDFNSILNLMMNDKKNRDKKINFSLVNERGEFFIDTHFTNEEIISSMYFYNRAN